jgi:hypothetical protein
LLKSKIYFPSLLAAGVVGVGKKKEKRKKTNNNNNISIASPRKDGEEQQLRVRP